MRRKRKEEEKKKRQRREEKRTVQFLQKGTPKMGCKKIADFPYLQYNCSYVYVCG